jgi:trehalose/maltose hydrolase-like predicted phosphorylase
MDEHRMVRIKTINCTFRQNSKEWSAYSFKINFRNQVITVSVNHQETTDGESALEIVLNDNLISVNPRQLQFKAST